MNFRRILGGLSSVFLLAAASPLYAQVITNVVPPLGSHGDVVEIYGNGFAPGNHHPTNFTVDFNGVISTHFTNAVTSDGNIEITNVPTNATPGFIHAFLNGNEAISPNPFIVITTNAYITNFAPVSGGSGTPVTLYGVHIISGGTTNVSFNGQLSQGTPSIGANSISVTAPNGVTTGPLIAISKYGAAHNFSTISNIVFPTTNFFVAPRIAKTSPFSPANGRPDTNVVITGTNFTGASAVTFGGLNALSFTVLNNTSIQAVVPTNSSTGPIGVFPPVLSPPLSSDSTTINFAMLPAIYSFTPAFGPTNTVLVITGAGLSEQAPHPVVTFGGGTVTTFGGFSENTLTCNIPTTATSGLITISTTNGSITSTQLFYLPASINGFAPGSGAAGTIVKITGFNFTNASAVSFNGIPASAFAVTNNNVLGAVAPAGATSGTIGITTPAGTINSTILFYIAPTITSFIPTHGEPGTNVMVTGTSFTNATAVLFNGVPAASFKVTNNTVLSAVVPGSATTGPITVAAPGGTNQSAGVFTIDSTDVAVSVTDLPNPVFIGSNLVYTIVVTNNGSVSASNVRLTNTLSSSVTLKAATTSQGSLTTNANPIFGNLGTINSGTPATVTLTVVPTAVGSITNTVTVLGDSGDSNPGNNSAVTVATVWPLPFLSITNLMSNGLVRISWPAPLSGFTLQFQTNLAPGMSWSNDPGVKTVNGTNTSVIETSIPPARFFRLTN